MTEIKINGPGQVKIADEVLAVIAGTAAMEVNGVAGLGGHFTNDIAGMLSRKNLSKGIAISVDGSDVAVSVDISVKAGMKIQEVSQEVQGKVKTAIETMTGLSVTEVNVSVGAVTGEKQRNA